jgi:hypothetical protein
MRSIICCHNQGEKIRRRKMRKIIFDVLVSAVITALFMGIAYMVYSVMNLISEKIGGIVIWIAIAVMVFGMNMILLKDKKG